MLRRAADVEKASTLRVTVIRYVGDWMERTITVGDKVKNKNKK